MGSLDEKPTMDKLDVLRVGGGNLWTINYTRYAAALEGALHHVRS